MDDSIIRMKINPLLSYRDIEILFYNNYDEYDFSSITDTQEFHQYRNDYMRELYEEAAYKSDAGAHFIGLLNIQKNIQKRNINKHILRSFLQKKCKKCG